MSTSPKQLAANQQNAAASTGPQTSAGKKRSALNALKHGLRSSVFVVPGLERDEDWKRHLAAVVESVAPDSYLEAVLAQDIALLTWRLGRVARAEREAVALLQETAVTDWVEERQLDWRERHGRHPDDLRASAQGAAQLAEDLTAYPALPPAAYRDGRAAALLFALAEEVEDLDLADPESFTPPPPLTNEDLEDYEYRGWTPELLQAAVEAVVAASGGTLAELTAAALDSARRTKRSAEIDLEVAETAIERLQRGRILPRTDDLEKVSRYEAHLRRALSKSLQELRAMQASRGSVTVIEAE